MGYQGYYLDRKSRQRWIYENFKDLLKGTIVDVGCDMGHLRDYLRDCSYIGIDIEGKPDISADLELGIPLVDRCADVVICVEVLEHLCNFHHLFDELCRVSKRYVILSLPNARELFFRIAFAFGLALSPYYKNWFQLHQDPSHDRHKWIFDYDSARRFVHIRAPLRGFKIIREFPYYDQYRPSLVKFVVGSLAKKFFLHPNVFALSYYCLLERKKFQTPGLESCTIL